MSNSVNDDHGSDHANDRANEMTSPISSHLKSVESELSLLVDELDRLERLELSEDQAQVEERWDSQLEEFRVKATTIRRILDRFHHADLPTRRYLRHHLDEEFSSLRRSYDSLREQFTSKEESERLEKGDTEWNG
jgi:hypothetical protein